MFNKTVDSITKVFTQAIKDLEVLEANASKALSVKYEQRNNINVDIENIHKEVARSEAIRTKLNKLVG